MSCFLLTKRAMQSYRKYDMQIFVGQQEYLAWNLFDKLEKALYNKITYGLRFRDLRAFN